LNGFSFNSICKEAGKAFQHQSKDEFFSAVQEYSVNPLSSVPRSAWYGTKAGINPAFHTSMITKSNPAYRFTFNSFFISISFN